MTRLMAAHYGLLTAIAVLVAGCVWLMLTGRAR